MKSIILCEGKTDIILYSYYLSRVCNWSSLNTKAHRAVKKAMSRRIVDMKIESDNQQFEWYFRDNDILCIYAVGSKDQFGNALKQIIELNLNTSGEIFERIAIISDRDDASSEDAIMQIAEEAFSSDAITFGQILHNCWNTSDSFTVMGEEKRISLLPLVIPPDETGTLETFLLNCRKEINEDEEILIKCGDRFVETADKNEYIHNRYLRQRGLKPKAKLGVYFAIVSPNRTYDEGRRILESIPWENYRRFNQTLSPLHEI